MPPPSAAKPPWQRNQVFRFFASLKLAVVLLLVLIVGAMAGTIYESSFDAKVARYYVYGAPWFNIWLILLATNLAVSALSRWPWKKHHVAFLVTHLGIITLLAGSLIGRIWGVEGTMTLFKGDPATNRLLLDEHQLRVQEPNGTVRGYRAEFLHRLPSPERPYDLGALDNGAHLRVVGYSSSLQGKLDPEPIPSGGSAAVHITIQTKMMGQKLESWLLTDDPQHSTFGMGLARIDFQRGVVPTAAGKAPAAPASSPNESVELEESIFAFVRTPEQIGRVRKGGSTGAKIHLLAPEGNSKGKLSVEVAGKKADYDVGQLIERETPIESTPFIMTVENYWPDFRIQDGKPGSASDQPNNPAVLVTLRGKAAPVTAASNVSPDGHGAEMPESGPSTNGGPPTMPPAGAEPMNRLTLFVDDKNELSYRLVSRKNGESSASVRPEEPITTGWADWTVTIDRVLPNAVAQMRFTPGDSPPAMESESWEGLLLQVEQNGKKTEQWAPAGWQIALPTSPTPTPVAYGWRVVSLPIGFELLNFEVQRNEGSDTPAGFKSTLRVTGADGETAEGQCWMNHPFSFPGAWWRTWTGLTYKISQASWNPENLSQTTVQVLRDPGWFFKWVGSLLIVAGVFMMFYLRPYRRQTVGQPIRPAEEKAEVVTVVGKAESLSRA